MKIQCDVCNKAAASVFCVADDAALCSDCDHRVHHANKLAGKHHRFSLLPPKQIPLCDIGTKLSVESTVYSSESLPIADKSPAETIPYVQPNLITPTNYTTSPAPEDGSVMNIPSSISDYLIETLPGWHVDDFLDFSSSPFDFCKGGGDLLMQAGENGVGVGGGGRNECSSSAAAAAEWASENSGIWVPQAPPPPLHPSQYTVISQPNVALGGGQIMCGKNTKESKNLSKSTVRKRVEDWSFTVPQISPQSVGSKRSRFAG